jgi:hypothetical protein
MTYLQRVQMLVKFGQGSNEGGGTRKPAALSYSITVSMFKVNIGDCTRKNGETGTSYQNC